MKKIFALFGYLPKSEIAEVHSKVIGITALNSTLRERNDNLEREIRQVISERERTKLAHEMLKEEYETAKRCHAKLAEAFGSRIPPTLIKP